MAEILSFIAFWIVIMALIGGALLLTPKFKPREKRENKENEIQDIADE